jgi:hypothetical protein
MKIKGVGQAELERIAKDLGLILYNTKRVGNFVQFVLRPPHGALPDAKFRAVGQNGRRKWAVCYHGHEEFMAEVFAINSNAIIASRMVRFDGEEEFHQKKDDAYNQNVGSQLSPLTYGNACNC